MLTSTFNGTAQFIQAKLTSHRNDSKRSRIGLADITDKYLITCSLFLHCGVCAHANVPRDVALTPASAAVRLMPNYSALSQLSWSQGISDYQTRRHRDVPFECHRKQITVIGLYI